MKKSVLLNSILAVACVCLLGYIGWYIKAIPVDDITATVDAGSETFVLDECDSQIVQSLYTEDRKWQVLSLQELQNYEQRMSAAEELNSELQRQHREAKDAFLAQQLQKAKEQAELLEKLREEALQSVTAQGGTGIDFSDVVYLNGIHVPPGGSTTDSITNASGKTGEVVVTPKDDSTLVVGGEVKDVDYLGQVTATYVCTCADCYDATKCGEVVLGGNCVLTDGGTIPADINILFEGGPSGTYHTQLSTRVSGRTILLLCGKHELAGTGATIYPKVTTDHSVG